MTSIGRSLGIIVIEFEIEVPSALLTLVCDFTSDIFKFLGKIVYLKLFNQLFLFCFFCNQFS
jgi:hypothetical protein